MHKSITTIKIDVGVFICLILLQKNWTDFHAVK